MSKNYGASLKDVRLAKPLPQIAGPGFFINKTAGLSPMYPSMADCSSGGVLFLGTWVCLRCR